MRKGYVAALALAASLILIAGVLVRPKPAARASAAPAAAASATAVKEQPAQAPPAPLPSRRGQMRQISDFLSERGTDVARHVVYVSSAQASGVLWPDGRLITAAPAPALVSTAAPPDQPTADRARLAPQSRFGQAGWIVVVARGSDGQPITASGILGGAANASCGTTSVRKLVFNAPLDASFAGAGVFDLSGDLLGIVIPCGDAWTAITPPSAEQLLGAQQGAEAVAWHDVGIRIRSPASEERRLMQVPSGGLFIAETRKGSRAFNMGLRPGDLLVRTGSEPITTTEDLLALGKDVTLVRQGRTITLSMTPDYTLDVPKAGAVLSSVQPETRLYRAGLRPGDRIIRASGVEDPGPTELNRLMASSKPVWLVYERDDRRIWAMLP